MISIPNDFGAAGAADPNVLKLPFQGGVKIVNKIKRKATKGTQAAGKFFHLGGTFETRILPHIRAFFHREKTGPVIKFYYGAGHNDELKMMMSQLHNFNLIEDTPLTLTELNKAWSLINVYIHKLEAATAIQDKPAIDFCNEQINRLHQLLDKTQIKKMLRSEFEIEDWQVLDEIDFELLKEHFECMRKLFNLQVFHDLHFQDEMKKHFGVKFKESLVAEALAKSLAYIGGLDGKTVQLPVKEQVGVNGVVYKMVEFQIKEIVLGDALPAYILETKDQQQRPWIVVRGTQLVTKKAKDGRECRTGAFESVIADTIDSKDIAKNVIVKALVHRPIVVEKGKLIQKESLNDIFLDWRKNNKKVNLAGHSLGGYLVNDIAVRFFDDVNIAYGFNGPGVGEEIAVKWKKKTEAELKKGVKTIKEIFLKIVNFNNEGDIVPSGGYAVIGTNIAIDTRNPNRVWHDHLRHSLTRNFNAQLIDINKENRKLARVILEITRFCVASIMHAVLRTFNSQGIPEWWRNRKLYAEALKLQGIE